MLWLAPFVTLTTGCDSYKTPELDPKRAHLITPAGKHDLELAIDTDERRYQHINGPNRHLVLLGEGDGIHVEFGFLRQQGLVIRPSREVGRLEFDEAGTYYRFNGSDETPLKISVKQQTDSEGIPTVYFVRYEAPKPLKDYKVGPLSGGTMSAREVSLIEKGEDDLHHFHFSFSAGENDYAVDVAFKVKVRKELDLSPPGMP